MPSPPPGVTYWTRDDWHAEPARSTLRPFAHPAAWLFVHHTVTLTGNDIAANFARVQTAAFGRGFADVSYGELIGPDLDGQVAVAEGRGVQWVGAHTVAQRDDGTEVDLNPVGIGIAFVGNYHPPAGPALDLTDGQVAAFLWRRRVLVEAGWLTADHTVTPHRNLYATACCGDNVVARFAELAVPLAAIPTPPAPPAPTPTPSLEEALSMQPFALISDSNEVRLFVAGQKVVSLGGLANTYGGLITEPDPIARPIGPVPETEAATLTARWNDSLVG